MHIIDRNQDPSAHIPVSSFIQWHAKETAVAENSSMTFFKIAEKTPVILEWMMSFNRDITLIFFSASNHKLALPFPGCTTSTKFLQRVASCISYLVDPSGKVCLV